MPTLIACFVAGICVAGFVSIWFSTAFKELSAKRNSLAALEEQLRLHEGLYTQTMDGPDAQSSARMLETSRMLCREAAKSYNLILRKPMNRFPALLMGFWTAEETNKLIRKYNKKEEKS